MSGFVNDEKIGGKTVVRKDDSVVNPVGAQVVRSRGAHKAVVDVESSARFGSTVGGTLSSLFLNAGLFFPVEKTEWVVLEEGRNAGGIAREEVELVLARRT
jgi:hypothetical protein